MERDPTIKALDAWFKEQLAVKAKQYVASVDEETHIVEFTPAGKLLHRDYMALSDALHYNNQADIDHEGYLFQQSHGVGVGYFVNEGKKLLGPGMVAHIAKTRYHDGRTRR